MRIDDLDEMRLLPVFAGAVPDNIYAMLRSSFLQRFPPGVELVQEGDPADFLHIVIDGSVELFSTYRERETTVEVLGAGQSFIVAAILLDRVYLKSARTLSVSRILMIPSEAVRRYFQDDSAFARSITIELALAYRSIVKELKGQKLRSSLERLVNWLLSRDLETGSTGQFDLPFDKRILASRLGMAPEVLSRSFASLVPYGVVVNGYSLQLRDTGALLKLAHPCATIDDPTT